VSEKYTLKHNPERIRSLMTAVFPILKVNADGNLASYVGTGFFISSPGLFVTAKHVLMDVIDESGVPIAGLSVFHLSGDGAYYQRPILRFQTNFVSDLAVGFLAPMEHNLTHAALENTALRLARRVAAPGDFVATFAYPNTAITLADANTRVNVFSYEVCGAVEEYLPNGRDMCILPGPCYRTSMQIIGGASGGPALDRNGLVIGVNSAGFDGTDISYITPINDIFRFTLTDLNVPWKPNGTAVHMRELAENGFLLFDSD
jgi:V8-like Glu-specific endopeptidase